MQAVTMVYIKPPLCRSCSQRISCIKIIILIAGDPRLPIIKAKIILLSLSLSCHRCELFTSNLTKVIDEY